jgi:FkbM family methyltransferase
VQDLGAHIGWFTLWCLDNGASKVVSIEATPESHKWHKLNFENDERVTSIHAAAVTQASYEENKTATFRIAPQGNTVAEVRNNLPLFALSDDHSHGKFRNLVFGFCRWVRLPSRQSRLRSCCRSTLISTW